MHTHTHCNSPLHCVQVSIVYTIGTQLKPARDNYVHSDPNLIINYYTSVVCVVIHAIHTFNALMIKLVIYHL